MIRSGAKVVEDAGVVTRGTGRFVSEASNDIIEGRIRCENDDLTRVYIQQGFIVDRRKMIYIQVRSNRGSERTRAARKQGRLLDQPGTAPPKSR